MVKGGYTPKDKSKAMSAYLRSCDEFDHAYGCYQYALHKMLGRGTPRDMQASLKYALKGCELGDMVSCQHVASLYEFGGEFGAVGIEADSQKALKYYKMSCDGGLQVSCDTYESLRQNIR